MTPQLLQMKTDETTTAPSPESPSTPLKRAPKLSPSRLRVEKWPKRKRVQLRRALWKTGVDAALIDTLIPNRIVAKSRKGPLGAIVVRDLSGTSTSPASQAVGVLEDVVGQESLIEAFAALEEELAPKHKDLLEKMVENRGLVPQKRHSLARLIAETKTEPVAVMRVYAKGAEVLGKTAASILAFRELPGMVKDLVRHAVDREGVCGACWGKGRVKRKPADKVAKDLCPQCKGSGAGWEISDHKEYAMTKLLDITQMTPKVPQVSITNQQQVAIGMKGGFMETLLHTADRILHPSPEIVDVSPTDYRTEQTEPGEGT